MPALAGAPTLLPRHIILPETLQRLAAANVTSTLESAAVLDSPLLLPPALLHGFEKFVRVRVARLISHATADDFQRYCTHRLSYHDVCKHNVFRNSWSRFNAAWLGMFQEQQDMLLLD